MLDFLKRNITTNKSKFLTNYKGVELPVELIIENRNGWRVRLASNKAIIRISAFYTDAQIDEIKVKCIEWIHKKLDAKPNLAALKPRNYENDSLIIMGDTIKVQVIELSGKQNHFAKFIQNDTIQLGLNKDDNNYNEISKKLLAKVVAKKYLIQMELRVREINNLFFKKTYSNISLKDVSSKWGSCSSNSSLCFSTKLLLAPEDVIDYVIVHELAHLIEMNHSGKFWHLVETAMPNYKEKEKWLKVYGHNCRF